MSTSSSPVKSPSPSPSNSSFEVDSDHGKGSPQKAPSTTLTKTQPAAPSAPRPAEPASTSQVKPTVTATQPSAPPPTAPATKAQVPAATTAAKPVATPQPQSPVKTAPAKDTHESSPSPSRVDKATATISTGQTAQLKPKDPSVSSADTVDDVDQGVRTTRILTAEQFKRLFQSDIAGVPHISSTSAGPSATYNTAPNRGANAPAPRSERGEPERPRTASKTRRPVDPFNGTRYGAMMAIPPQSSKTARKLRKSVLRSSSARSSSPTRPQTAQSTRSTAGGDNGAAAPSLPEQQNAARLMEQLLALKLQLQLKDQRVHQLLRQKGQLEQDNAHLAAMKFAKHAATGEIQPADEVILHLKSRISFLEERLRLSEDEVQTIKHTSKTLRIVTLQEQAATYLAEVQRLKSTLKDKERQERRGGDGAALVEAQALVNSKDAQLMAAQEKNRSLKVQLKTALEETARAGKERDVAVAEAQELKQHMKNVKEAPAEVLRLQMELKLAESRLADCKAELSRASGDRDAAHRTNQSRDETLNAAFKDRDAMRADMEQLKLQLKAQEALADAKVAKALEDSKKETEQRIREAMLFAQDREATLRADSRDIRERNKELEAQLIKLAADHRDEVEALKAKEQQRHENMLRTISTYDRESQEGHAKAVKDAEQRVAAEREALDRERKKLEAEAARLKQLAEESAAATKKDTGVSEAEIQRREAQAKERGEREARDRLEKEIKERMDREVKDRVDRALKEKSDADAKDRQAHAEHSDRETRERIEKELAARLQKEYDEKIQRVEREVREKTEREVREKTEREVREKTEREVREKTEREVREKTEREVKERFESETRARVEKETQQRVEAEYRAKLETEHRAKLEKEEQARKAAVAVAPPPTTQPIPPPAPAPSTHDPSTKPQPVVGRYGDHAVTDSGQTRAAVERQSIDSAVLGSDTPREVSVAHPPPPPAPTNQGVKTAPNSAPTAPAPTAPKNEVPPPVATPAPPAKQVAVPAPPAPTAQPKAPTTATPSTTAAAKAPAPPKAAPPAKRDASELTFSEGGGGADDDDDDESDTVTFEDVKPAPGKQPAANPATAKAAAPAPAKAAPPKAAPTAAAPAVKAPAKAPSGKGAAAVSSSSGSSDSSSEEDDNFNIESD